MRGSLVRCVRGLVVGGMSATLLGCPNPQTYGTPRTTPPGKVQHTVAIEGLHASSTTSAPAPASGTAATTGSNHTSSVTVPMLPTYQIRVGLVDRVDIGVRVTNLSALGTDVKWNFLKTKSVDIAIDPGAQANYFSIDKTTLFILYGHLPLLVGLNFNESTTLVLSGGLVAAYASASVSGDDAARTVGDGGLGARAGIGFQYRIDDSFALHPEVTGMRFLNDTDNLALVFGLGFNFGRLPSYATGSENDENPEEKPQEVAPPASSTPAASPRTGG